MQTYHFFQVDVFTNQVFGGNPLAVFPEADGLTTEVMQRIAREMNLSETTFVFPPTVPDADYKVRIFSPEQEMPFAGHPVVGTHWVLAYLGKTRLSEPSVTVKFELGVGVRAATLHVKQGKVSRVVMDHQKPVFGSAASGDQVVELARALGLPTNTIRDTGWPVQVVSSGIPQLFVPVSALREIQRLTVSRQDTGLLARVCEAIDPVKRCSGTIMVFCTDTVNLQANVHTRMFAPSVGVPEDPATGSSSGGLGAYLVQHKVVKATLPTTHILAEQGLEMGRASSIYIEVDGGPGNIQMIRVGGDVVPVIEGSISW